MCTSGAPHLVYGLQELQPGMGSLAHQLPLGNVPTFVMVA